MSTVLCFPVAGLCTESPADDSVVSMVSTSVAKWNKNEMEIASLEQDSKGKSEERVNSNEGYGSD